MPLRVEGVGGEKVSQGRDTDYVRDWVLEQHRWSKDQHEQRWCRDHFEFYALYRNFVRGGLDPDDLHSAINLGLAFPLVKILSARLVAPWQAGDRLMEAIPTDPMSQALAPKISAYVNTQLVHRIPRAFSKLELVKESAIALGRGILKPMMRTRPAETKLGRHQITFPVSRMLGIPMPDIPLGSMLRWQRTPPAKYMTFEYVDPFQWWYIGSDRWAEGADTTFEESYLTDSEVVRRVESGEFTEKFPYEPDGALGYDNYHERRRSLDYGAYGDNVKSNQQGPRPHRLIEVQGLVETRQKRNGFPVLEKRLVQILDERYVVKNERLASWDAKPEYIVFELFQDIAGERPMGLIEPVEQILFAMDDFISIAMDNGRKIVESPFAIDPDAMESDELYLGAGAINWIRNPTMAVSSLNMKDLPSSFYELMGLLNEVLYRVTGVSDLMGGTPTEAVQQGAQTARGMGLLANMASARVIPITAKMDHELYRKLAQWIHQTGRLRLEGKEYVRVQGSDTPSFDQVTPVDLDATIDFAFNTKALDAASGVRRQEFIDMIGLLANLASSGQLMAQGHYLDVYEIARMLMTEFDRGQEIDAILKKIPGLPGAPTVPPGGPFATPAAPGMLPGAPSPPAGAPNPAPAMPRLPQRTE